MRYSAIARRLARGRKVMGLWSTLKGTVMAVAAVLNIVSDKVCYNGIGCFSNEEPFNNAAGHLPQSPAKIGVLFMLYTRVNKQLPQVISKNPDLVKASYFSSVTKTYFIIHGYRDDGRESWLVKMKDALLEKEDVNVIIVDWEKGADTKDYNQAASNTRVVGALIAQLMEALKTQTGAKYNNMHLIGHSLGAHTAGYAGRRIRGTARITGLDPAGLSFAGKHPDVRLDKTDAAFVDVIHTDGQPILSFGLGSHKRMGDADFYPNGGKNQPGCKAPGLHVFKLITGKFKSFTKGVGCDHARSRDLYIESIKSSCSFSALPCKNVFDFENGFCTCNGPCPRMGHFADVGTPRGTFYLMTNGASPFCKQ